MKRYNKGVILGILILGLTMQLAFAELLPKKTKTIKETEGMQKRKDFLLELKATLSKKDWIVVCNPLDPSTGSTQTTDVLTFYEEKFTSKNLSAQGFPSVAYTLTLEEDGTVIWEAMLENENRGIVFWRGRLKDNSLSGFFTFLSNDGQLKDFSFQSIATTG